MINGIHAIICAKDASKVRELFRDVLGFPCQDAGGGWLVFALPPAELGVHPSEDGEHHELFLMCDDLPATVEHLRTKGVSCSAVSEAQWGSVTSIALPGGGTIGLYQPKHRTAIDCE